jgi:hypothetical protein
MTVLAMDPEEPQVELVNEEVRVRAINFGRQARAAPRPATTRSRSTRSTPERCDRLCGIVEEASTILRVVSTVVRGASEICERYKKMRLEALALIEERRIQAED